MTRKRIWAAIWVAGAASAASKVAINSGHPSTLWNAVQDCADVVGLVALALLVCSYLAQRRRRINA
jgi:hypothetical protein